MQLNQITANIENKTNKMMSIKLKVKEKRSLEEIMQDLEDGVLRFYNEITSCDTKEELEKLNQKYSDAEQARPGPTFEDIARTRRRNDWLATSEFDARIIWWNTFKKRDPEGFEKAKEIVYPYDIQHILTPGGYWSVYVLGEGEFEPYKEEITAMVLDKIEKRANKSIKKMLLKAADASFSLFSRKERRDRYDEVHGKMILTDNEPIWYNRTSSNDYQILYKNSEHNSPIRAPIDGLYGGLARIYKLASEAAGRDNLTGEETVRQFKYSRKMKRSLMKRFFVEHDALP